MKHLVVDSDLENADWTKQSWDLPPYKSEEFNEVVPDLAGFKKTPVYAAAVKKGLIVNDQWVGKTQDQGRPAPGSKSKRRHLHIHLEKKQ
jgi:hypothetical protein